MVAEVRPLPAEVVAAAAAHGRVLAEDVAAVRTQPALDLSAMDGWAVRSADIAAVPARSVGGTAAGRGFAGRLTRARRCGSSPARSCPPAPIRS